MDPMMQMNPMMMGSMVPPMTPGAGNPVGSMPQMTMGMPGMVDSNSVCGMPGGVEQLRQTAIAGYQQNMNSLAMMGYAPYQNPNAGMANYGQAGYGQAVQQQQPQPKLSEAEEKMVRARARAIGGSNDLDGNGHASCAEKDMANHIRDQFKTQQQENAGLQIMGLQSLQRPPR